MDAEAKDGACCDRCAGALVAILVILVILIIVYRMRWLNWALPSRWRAGCENHPPSKTGGGKQNFVGNWSRTDRGKPTLIYATADARWPLVNLGTYV